MRVNDPADQSANPVERREKLSNHVYYRRGTPLEFVIKQPKRKSGPLMSVDVLYFMMINSGVNHF